MMQLERFKILILSLVTSISFSIILSSCEPQVQATIPNPQSNHLELVSQGITYPLIEHFVYSTEKGVIADGKWFDKIALEMDPTLKEDLTAAMEIPFADDFTFMKVGSSGSEKVEKLSMNIFDENLEIIQSNIDKPVIPTKAGLYYVAVLFSWANKDDSSSYQYIFKTRRL